MPTGKAAALTGSRLPLKVLLIEDSAVIRESLSEALGSTGMLQVTGVAETADEAVRTLKEDSFDAVIVDIQLRRGSGMDVLSYLHDAGMLPNVMAVVLTNYALATYRKRCQQLGVQYFFDKSLEFDRVIEVLDDFASSRQA
ncbi:response regulator [Pandoraea nosoerga]|uniref:Chemotaxis protein CheY n=1 Tax=Pandoraea nosoerga TaxID=2508296 RepID=A0A5E4WKM3_9BURK|nr:MULTISPECIES: response regulator [Pandoraea]MBN4667790.1 response regulator [Pandoraea nosoerga]MBN4675556.1 response regulator [Pandoraea nosoerga]MBN4682649.1 response regulator [Pandoraea nosoerga]MBN4746858.1 response regulator [Pandoraea nosoerga]VVE23555.1 chemotaxis protein CheY [Pandoraea nosoerga]